MNAPRPQRDIDISVVIVSYNVKFYTEQCIHSVLQSSRNLRTEIIVVDNASSDGSPAYLREKFPEIILIDNAENVGFSKANNQGFAIARGAYILILNPDTVLPEDALWKLKLFYEQAEKPGLIGPMLVDGRGEYLPESKRGFPDLMTSIFKITGLNKLFPKSPVINHYYMGNLSPDETNPVEVLVGCFMFLSREVLDQVQGFDPDYFMYGEDIDLSYRVTQQGYINYYYPDVQVIHYKGESTQKGSVDYVRMFYEAMITFADKHYSKSTAFIYKILIRIAMFFKGGLSILWRLISKVKVYFLDYIFTFLSLLVVKNFWNLYVRPDIKYYQDMTLQAFGLFALIWVIVLYFNGVYDKPYKGFRIWRGGFMAMASVLIFYSLLPVEYRFSRGITLFGSITASLVMVLYRWLLSAMSIPGFNLTENNKKGILLVGDKGDKNYIENNFNTDFLKLDIKGFVNPEEDNQSLGEIQQLPAIAHSLNIHELIFTYSPEMSYQQIIQWFRRLKGTYEFKIFRKNAQTIIGSNSKNTAGDLYSLDPIYLIETSANRRNKRVFDIASSISLLLFFPVLIFFFKSGEWRQVFSVLLGKKTWVGYNAEVDSKYLPEVRSSVVDVVSDPEDTSPVLQEKIRHDYAMNYSIYRDFNILWNKLFS